MGINKKDYTKINVSIPTWIVKDFKKLCVKYGAKTSTRIAKLMLDDIRREEELIELQK